MGSGSSKHKARRVGSRAVDSHEEEHGDGNTASTMSTSITNTSRIASTISLRKNEDRNLNAAPSQGHSNHIGSKNDQLSISADSQLSTLRAMTIASNFDNDESPTSPTFKQKLDELNSINVKIAKFKVGIDRKKISIDEKSPSVFKYRTPHFRASAMVELPPLENLTRLNIGWIQVCLSLKFINVYGSEGMTSWELPMLVTEKQDMISDSDGNRYPWYGSKSEVQLAQGPTRHATNVSTHMNDNFYPRVTWYIPSPEHTRDARLTRVCRRQRFMTCLVMCHAAPDQASSSRSYTQPQVPTSSSSTTTNLCQHLSAFRILRAVRWSMDVDITLDPSKSRGQRTMQVLPLHQRQPQLIQDENTETIILRRRALRPPSANVSQTLIWRPRIGPPALIVRPTDKSVSVDGYAELTTAYYNDLITELQNAGGSSSS